MDEFLLWVKENFWAIMFVITLIKVSDICAMAFVAMIMFFGDPPQWAYIVFAVVAFYLKPNENPTKKVKILFDRPDK